MAYTRSLPDSERFTARAVVLFSRRRRRMVKQMLRHNHDPGFIARATAWLEAWKPRAGCG